MTNFQGFTQDSFNFFKELKLNNNKKWFKDNRSRYHDLRDRLIDLVEDVASRYISSKYPELEIKADSLHCLSRINRKWPTENEAYYPYLWAAFFRKSIGDKTKDFQLYLTLHDAYFEIGIYFGVNVGEAFKDIFRKKVEEHREEFLALVQKLPSTFKFLVTRDVQTHDIPPEDNVIRSDEVLDAWLQSENLEIVRVYDENEPVLQTPKLVDSVIEDFSKLDDIYQFIFTAYKPRIEDKTDDEENDVIRIWQISPGRNEQGFWHEFKEKEIIAMGWDLLGDLTQYSSREEIENALKQYYPSDYPPNSSPYNAYNSCWIFSHEIKVGDIVVAKWGNTKKLYGIGKVLKGYTFDDARAYFKHVLGIKWHISFEDPIEVEVTKRFVQWTAHRCNLDKFDEIKRSILAIYPTYVSKFKLLLNEVIEIVPLNLQPSDIHTDLIVNEDVFSQVCANLNSGSHMIMTGPVGTGKTTLSEDICRAATANAFCEGYVLTTATSDWTTFDTIGGYMPTDEGKLRFEEGKFLEAIRGDKWLILDEINRADIDKAFGQLFTVLSGQRVELPFKDEHGNTIIVESSPQLRSLFDPDTSTYIVGKNWRILATMNIYDMNFLFDMSYAFMRRFAFVYLDVPTQYDELIERWCVEKNIEDTTCTQLKQLIQLPERKIGPAIIRDIIEYLERRGNGEIELAEAIIGYIIPQLEGLERDRTQNCWTHIKTLFENQEIPNQTILPILQQLVGIDII